MSAPAHQPTVRRGDPLIRRAAFVVVAAIVIGLAWFGGTKLWGANNPTPPRITIDTAAGGHYVFNVEWAVNEQQRAQGLMNRQKLAEDAGMVFDFQTEQPVSFWMHDTPLPLDMIFIHADGTIYRIQQRAVPYSDQAIPSGASVRYVLEVNGGTAQRLGIKPGDRVRFN